MLFLSVLIVAAVCLLGAAVCCVGCATCVGCCVADDVALKPRSNVGLGLGAEPCSAAAQCTPHSSANTLSLWSPSADRRRHLYSPLCLRLCSARSPLPQQPFPTPPSELKPRTQNNHGQNTATTQQGGDAHVGGRGRGSVDHCASERARAHEQRRHSASGADALRRQPQTASTQGSREMQHLLRRLLRCATPLSFVLSPLLSVVRSALQPSPAAVRSGPRQRRRTRIARGSRSARSIRERRAYELEHKDVCAQHATDFGDCDAPGAAAAAAAALCAPIHRALAPAAMAAAALRCVRCAEPAALQRSSTILSVAARQWICGLAPCCRLCCARGVSSAVRVWRFELELLELQSLLPPAFLRSDPTNHE